MVDMNFTESEDRPNADTLPGKFNGNEVRFCYIRTEPWFVAKDVCRALGYKNHIVTLRKLGNDEANVTRTFGIKTLLSGKQRARLINIEGIDKLSAMSYGPGASKFPLFIGLNLWETMVQGVLDRIEDTGGNGVSLYQLMRKKPYPGANENEVKTALEQFIYDAVIERTASGLYRVYQEPEPVDTMALLNCGPHTSAPVLPAMDGDDDEKELDLN